MTEVDDEAIARARNEIDVMKRIVDALEPLDADTRMRVLAASAILTGVAPMESVLALLRAL